MVKYVHMTTTLEEAIQQVKDLPDSRQQELAEIIIALLGKDSHMRVIAY